MASLRNERFPKCPDGMNIDNHGKCQGCLTGQQKNPKTNKCAPVAASADSR